MREEEGQYHEKMADCQTRLLALQLSSTTPLRSTPSSPHLALCQPGESGVSETKSNPESIGQAGRQAVRAAHTQVSRPAAGAPQSMTQSQSSTSFTTTTNLHCNRLPPVTRLTGMGALG